MLLACLYLQLGIAVMQPHPTPSSPDVYWRWDITHVVNPYGTVEIGCEIPVWKRLSFSLSARHISSMPVGDFGSNTVEFSVRWHPWKKD